MSDRTRPHALTAMTVAALALLIAGCAAPADPVTTEPDTGGSAGAPPTAEPVVRGDDESAYEVPDAPAEFAQIPGDVLTTIENITYQIQGAEFPLVDGVHDEPAQRMHVTVVPPAAIGDLTSDGISDAAVLLAQQTGGSGTFVYLAVVTDVNGDASAADVVFLGDRVKVTAMNIVDGVLTVDVVTHGPDDPMCCPSDVQTWMFTVVDGQIELISEMGPSSITG